MIRIMNGGTVEGGRRKEGGRSGETGRRKLISGRRYTKNKKNNKENAEQVSIKTNKQYNNYLTFPFPPTTGESSW